MKHLERLTLCVVILLTFQLMVMLFPIGTGVMVYVRNKDTIDAMSRVDGRMIVEKVNMLKDVPIQNMSRNANEATSKLREIMQQAHVLAENNNSNMFGDLKRLVHKALDPMETVKEFMNNRTTTTLINILDKTMGILGKMNNAEVHNVVSSILNISQEIPLNIFNKSLHTLDDADKTIAKMNIILGKFVN
jgi:hypothetical protein